jgi:hypothetical protein
MDPVIIKLLAEMPTAAAVIITMVILIKFLKDERAEQRQERQATHTFFKDIHAEHLYAREQTRMALEKHSDVTQQNVIATQRNTDTLDRLSASIERCGLRVEPPKRPI